MKTVYKSCIILLLLAAVVHCGLTFFSYHQLEINAFWFWGTGLALLYAGLLNWINLVAPVPLVSRLVVLTNLLLALTLSGLAMQQPWPHIILLAGIAVGLLACAWLWRGETSRQPL
ncbi:MAG: hypothetical protein H7Z21_11705 [Hymenobacter sp.]|nr:hypothetical protein [Hymenobacter sp.]